VQWQKSFKNDDRVPRSEGQKTLALSAFMLTSQPTPLARKAIVMEMWESGAHTIVCSCLILTAFFKFVSFSPSRFLSTTTRQQALVQSQKLENFSSAWAGKSLKTQKPRLGP